MIRRLAIAAVLTATVAGLVPARAEAALSQCGNGVVCFWRDANYTGPFRATNVSQITDLRSVTYAGSSVSMQDSITAIANHTTNWLCIYENINLDRGTTGTSLNGIRWLQPGGEISNLTNAPLRPPTTWNDAISSFAMATPISGLPGTWCYLGRWGTLFPAYVNPASGVVATPR